jgi:hypothetical protein
MNRELDLILDDCLAQLQSGQSLESCLARDPEHADELRPLLELATAVRALPEPRARPSAVRAGRWRMLDAVDAKSGSQPVSRAILSRYTERFISRIIGKENRNMTLVTRFAMLALVVALLLSGGRAIIVSSDALPGDTLYPLKLAVEEARLRLTTDQDEREQLKLERQAERQAEVQELLQRGREAEVRFWGELLALDGESWDVSGLVVKLDAATVVQGSPTLGATVEVQAKTQADGSILARRLIVQTVPRSMPGQTPTPQPTSTPVPTSTPPPTPTPRPPSPTFTPISTASPFPTRTPFNQPPGTPSPTPTPQPPSPSLTPILTASPFPTSTPFGQAQDTPPPTPTPQPQLPSLTPTAPPPPTNMPNPTATPGAVQPTYTPYHTPTPFPLPTPYTPTPPYPTVTPYPSLTPSLTATPYHTPTPSATFTPGGPTATFSSPTYTPDHTLTPSPTYTPSPMPTTYPTRTPYPTLTPTLTSTPSP